jgi:WD40 repeat protein
MTGQFQSLYDVAWSPDGKLLATSGEERQDKSIKLWLVS